MSRSRIAAFAFAFAAAGLTPAAPVLADGIAITHSAAGCVPADRYLRVTAGGTPADAVASAELQFRGGSDGDWYAARMARADGTWSAYLPRARRGTTRVEYRIVMTGTDAAASASPVHALAVDSECVDADAAIEVTAPIVVRVPAGAPPVPPVPPGFSPAGVVAEEPPSKSRRTLALVSGAAVAGAAIAAGAADGESAPAVRDVPDFSFAGTRPDPGTVFTIGAQDLVVLVRMSRIPSRPLDLSWSLVFNSPTTPSCQVVMFGRFNDAQAPLELALTAPLSMSAACPGTFEADTARLTVFTNGAVVLDSTLALPFTFRR